MDSSAGYCVVELRDEQSGVTFPMAVMYPALTPEKPERLGPYTLELATGAALKEGIFPLVIISHGSGGTHLGYRTLARHLARNGFVVGMPEHPFNNRNNNTHDNTIANLKDRPRHIRIAVDWFFASGKFSRSLRQGSFRMIGHSMGGYTSLAVAGGMPASFSRESPDGRELQVSVLHDPRLTTLVLLAPATVWFRMPGALSAVTAPILMLCGELDEYAPPEVHAEIVVGGVPDRSKVEYENIKNAGHFSFMSRFPESMTSPAFQPSQDPPGFDRGQFLTELDSRVLEFLQLNV